MRGAQEWKEVAAAVVGPAGRRRPFCEEPFRIQVGGGAAMTVVRPARGTHGLPAEESTAVVILQGRGGAVKRIAEITPSQIVRIFLDRPSGVA